MKNKILTGFCTGVFAVFLILQANVFADFNLLTDGFEGGNYDNWVTTVADAPILSIVPSGDSNVLRWDVAGTTLQGIRTAGSVGSSYVNYSVEADVKAAAVVSDTTYQIFLCARYQDESNKYIFGYKNKNFYIDKYVNNVKTNLCQTSITTAMDIALTHKFKAVLNGSALQFYVDGVLRGDATDTAFSVGGAGVLSSSSTLEVDNVVINEITPDTQMMPVELTKVKVYDRFNNEIINGSKTSVGDITINTTLFRRNYASASASFITALYDNNDKILDFSSVPVDFSSSNIVSVNSGLKAPYNNVNCRIKAFLWDGIDSIIPLRSLVSDVSFASMPTSELSSDFFGVCDKPEISDDYIDHLDSIIASGVKWLRIYPKWSTIETAKGVYNDTYLTKLDYIVNTCYANNVNIDFILWDVPLWASSNASSTLYKPKDWLDWESYVEYITNRYSGKVKTWEVWNEPDNLAYWKSTLDDYNTLLQKAYEKIKATSFNNQVLVGGMALADAAGFTWFDNLVSKGAANYFDIINYHSYGSSQGNTTVMSKAYNNLMVVVNKYSSQLASKKIWVTETGYSSAVTTGNIIPKEADKANALDFTYTLHKGLPNVERIFYYSYRNTNTGTAIADNYGLVGKDLTPLKALSYYQSVNGAVSNFVLQQNFPTKAPNLLPLVYVPETGASSPVYESGNMRIASNSNMYMNINDNWLYDTNYTMDTTAYVDVTYLDEGSSEWCLQYDGATNAYAQTENQTLTNSGEWKTKTFTLTDIKFANRQTNSCDFNISVISGELVVKNVTVRKRNDNGVSILGSTDLNARLYRLDVSAGEGNALVATIGGRECRQLPVGGSRYIYFQVPKGFIKPEDRAVKIGLTYWDDGKDIISIMYINAANSYKEYRITKTDTDTWVYKEITITDANFKGVQNNTSDFRISNTWPGAITDNIEYISKVEVFKQ